MRNIYLILFVLLSVKSFSQEVITISKVDLGYFQSPNQVNVFEDSPMQPINMNCIIGDHWTQSGGHSSAVGFKEYCFYTDGTFKYKRGYSGGVYMETAFLGKYKFDEHNNTINLSVKSIKSGGHIQPKYKPKKSNMPDKLKILGFNDTIVSIQIAHENLMDTLVFFRRPGCIKDQTWDYAKKYTKEYENDECEINENDWEHRLEFQDFGQLIYTAGNTWNKYKKLTFVCKYHFQNNMMYVEIGSKSIYDSNFGINSVEKFIPAKRAYIRVDIKNRCVNLSDLRDMMNDHLSRKNWSYNGCKYETEYPVSHSTNDEWVVMPSIKDE